MSILRHKNQKNNIQDKTTERISKIKKKKKKRANRQILQIPGINNIIKERCSCQDTSIYQIQAKCFFCYIASSPTAGQLILSKYLMQAEP